MPSRVADACSDLTILRELTPYSGTVSSSEKERTFSLKAAAAPALMTLTPRARVDPTTQAT